MKIHPLFELFNTFQDSQEALFSIQTGAISLLDNPEYCAFFLSFVSEKQKQFPTFEQWQRFLKSESKLPIKPIKENPFLYKDVVLRNGNSLESKVYRAYIFEKKLDKYYQELSQVQEKNDKKRKIKEKYNIDKLGYCRYVFGLLSDADKAFLSQDITFEIPEYKRVLHTHISGGTGSGKSEIMKTLIHHYLTKDTNSALVLIDPHGKIARESAQFKDNIDTERLVFISPNLDNLTTPVFNPFDIGAAPDSITLDIATQELIGAFREILKETEFTPQMETLLKPCITTLFLYPGATIYHLQKFMSLDENGELLAFASANLPNPTQRIFLQTDFLKSSYAPSRQSIRTKIQSLLNSQVFLNFLVGKSSFSLEKAIEEKKFIVFSLSRSSGVETSDTIGRFILSRLQSIAMLRDKLSSEDLEKAVPIHLFIDECQHYVTRSIDTILTETRKYKLYLTLTNQFIDQIEDLLIKKAINGNTALKITGKQTDTRTIETISKTTGANTEEVKNLSQGSFHIKSGELPSMIVKNKSNLIDNVHAMSSEEWEVLKQKQIECYYRPINANAIFAPSSSKTVNQDTTEPKHRKKRSLN